MNNTDVAREKVKELIRQQRAMDIATQENAHVFATLLVGRLKHCYPSVLVKLKKELANYNMHTGEWKE